MGDLQITPTEQIVVTCTQDGCQAKGAQMEAPRHLCVGTGLHIRAQYVCPYCDCDLRVLPPLVVRPAMTLDEGQQVVNLIQERLGLLAATDEVSEERVLLEMALERITGPGS